MPVILVKGAPTAMKASHGDWFGDPNYHDRHTLRSSRRAACIADNMPDTATFLDVGCNRGITTSCLLRLRKIQRATGVEFSKDYVEKSLLNDQRFSLLIGDISAIDIPTNYDVVFYGAVHHHVVREKGIKVATDVLKKLASRCNEHLFFETGHISEGSRWTWQREIRRYFRTDEEHIFFLLRHIEPYIIDFQIVGRFRIHGIRRWLIRIDMKKNTQFRLGDQFKIKNISLQDRILEPLPVPKGLGRAMGTQYFRTTDGQLPALFVKKRPLSDHINRGEYEIGRQVDAEWAVRPLGLTGNDEIAFPLINGTPIAEIKRTSLPNQSEIAQKVIDIFRYLLATPADSNNALLLPSCKKTPLADIVDLNQRNLIIAEQNEESILYLTDFERQSNHYIWKNKIHIGRILVRLRSHIFFGATQYCHGVALGAATLIRYQFKSERDRIRDRQPSLASYLVSELRSLFGRFIIRVFPFLNQR